VWPICAGLPLVSSHFVQPFIHTYDNTCTTYTTPNTAGAIGAHLRAVFAGFPLVRSHFVQPLIHVQPLPCLPHFAPEHTHRGSAAVAQHQRCVVWSAVLLVGNLSSSSSSSSSAVQCSAVGKRAAAALCSSECGCCSPAPALRCLACCTPGRRSEHSKCRQQLSKQVGQWLKPSAWRLRIMKVCRTKTRCSCQSTCL
jgi:hypothetical protein